MQNAIVSDLLDQRDVPQYLGGAVSVNLLTNWRYRGIGPRFVKIGRKVFYRRTDLDSWIEAQLVETQGGAR